MLGRKENIYWWILLLIIGACSKGSNEGEASISVVSPFMSSNLAEYDSIVALMTIEEKLGQLVYYEQKGIPTDETIALVQNGLIGGIQFSEITPTTYSLWRDSLKSISPNPIFISLHNTNSFHAAFTGSAELPAKDAWLATGIDSLYRFPQRMFLQQISHLDIDLASVFFDQASIINPDSEQLGVIKYCSKKRILPIIESNAISSFTYADSSIQQLQMLHHFEEYKNAGLAGICFNLSNYESEKLVQTARFFRHHLEYGGLLIGRINRSHDIIPSLQLDIDLIKADIPPVVTLEVLLDEYGNGILNEQWLDRKVAKLLQAKSWVNKEESKATAVSKAKTLPASFSGVIEASNNDNTSTEDYFYDPSWAYWRHHVLSSSLVLAANPSFTIPLSVSPDKTYQLIHLGQSQTTHFNNYFAKYAPFQSWEAKDWESISRLASRTNQGTSNIIVLHDYALDSLEATELLKWNSNPDPIVLVNLGQAKNLALLDTSLVVIQSYDLSSMTQELVPQLLFGGIAAKGQLINYYSSFFCAGQGIHTNAVRLHYGIPQEANIDPKSMVGIDAIVRSAIQQKAFPGAQVMVVKEGNVLYHKSFGHHTYDQKQQVATTDLYDLASITKISATTLMAMKQYEDEDYQLNDKLKNHLDLGKRSGLRNITPSQLLTHRTGLQAHLPVIPYLQYRDKDNADCSFYFCKQASDSFSIQVADQFYFNATYFDQIWEDLYKLKTKRTKYKYSDANFVLLQQMLESKGGQSLDSLLSLHFYKKLGLRRTLFNPLKNTSKSNIVPTQDDQRWRYQLLQGYVHDETAALMGGVAGHAGLFSNTEELAIIFQMLLNGGTYGEASFLKASTIQKFTAAKYGNHRGLGFDKPKEKNIKEGKFPRQATTDIYGHTGFTGGCVWVDPDNELIYILLSNRVYPDANNKLIFKKRVRERVHQTIYNSFDSFSPSLPMLNDDLISLN